MTMYGGFTSKWRIIDGKKRKFSDSDIYQIVDEEMVSHREAHHAPTHKFPEHRYSVLECAKRWGIDSISDAERIVGMINPFPEFTTGFVTVSWSATLPTRRDLTEFEALQAFRGKTIADLLGEEETA